MIHSSERTRGKKGQNTAKEDTIEQEVRSYTVKYSYTVWNQQTHRKIRRNKTWIERKTYKTPFISDTIKHRKEKVKHNKTRQIKQKNIANCFSRHVSIRQK